MLTEKIKTQINESLKNGDKVRLSTLRMLISEVHNEEIDKKGELTDDEVVGVVKKEVKKRKDAIEAYKAAGRKDKEDEEEAELKILEEFMPQQMSDEELQKLVDEAIKELGIDKISDQPSQEATARQSMGKVIGAVMGKAKGQADGAKVAEFVKKALAS